MGRVEEPALERWRQRAPRADMASLPAECDETHPCEGLGRHATFRNFGMAFLTLFRVSTGDNWNGIMKVSSSFSPGPISVLQPRLLAKMNWT